MHSLHLGSEREVVTAFAIYEQDQPIKSIHSPLSRLVFGLNSIPDLARQCEAPPGNAITDDDLSLRATGMPVAVFVGDVVFHSSKTPAAIANQFGFKSETKLEELTSAKSRRHCGEHFSALIRAKGGCRTLSLLDYEQAWGRALAVACHASNPPQR